MTLVFLLIPVAYLLGTFPSAGIVANAKGCDITQEGSGNPGASNVFRVLGWKAGALVFALDIGKGAAAAGVGIAIDAHRGAYLLGVAAVLGHVFPITRRFRGGRGVATAGGVMAALFPVILAAVGLVWIFIARVLHKASVASIVAALAAPLLVAATGRGRLDIAVTSFLGLLVIARHLGNIRRLVRGEEPNVAPTATATPTPTPNDGDR